MGLGLGTSCFQTLELLVNVSENFDTNTVLQKGDALACFLFDIALEKAIEDAEIDNRRNVAGDMP